MTTTRYCGVLISKHKTNFKTRLREPLLILQRILKFCYRQLAPKINPQRHLRFAVLSGHRSPEGFLRAIRLRPPQSAICQLFFCPRDPDLLERRRPADSCVRCAVLVNRRQPNSELWFRAFSGSSDLRCDAANSVALKRSNRSL